MTKIKSTLHIQNKITQLRKEICLTQQELADAIDVTRATINALEKGNYNPSLELTFRLAKFFDLEIQDIFYIKENKK